MDRCKHCQALAPVLEASARELLADTSPPGAAEHICFGKVDATSAAGMFLGMRFFIGGFPRAFLPSPCCVTPNTCCCLLPPGALADVRPLCVALADIMLVSASHEVRNYEQLTGSRTQAAIVQWVRAGHVQVLKMMNFVLKMVHFVLEMISFSLIMMDSVLKMACRRSRREASCVLIYK